MEGKNKVVGGSRSKVGGSFVIPRHTKLVFPRFNGQEDPLGWLNRCEHFFRHQQTSKEEKIGLASFHLEDITQLWFVQLKIDLHKPSWYDF